MIPVRYMPLAAGDPPTADFFNSANNYVWEPGPPISDAAPRGWRKVVKDADGADTCPAAGWTKLKGLRRFLARRARLLPRAGGAYLIWVTGPFEDEFDERKVGVQVGICHHRTQPAVLEGGFSSVDDLVEDIRARFPSELLEAE